jgi:hypothetical protein
MSELRSVTVVTGVRGFIPFDSVYHISPRLKQDSLVNCAHQRIRSAH